PVCDQRAKRWNRARDRAALGIKTRGARVRAARAAVDREAAGAPRAGAAGTGRGVRGGDARACTTRAPAAPDGARRAAGPGGVAREHPQSALALGVVQPQRTHLPELAAGDDARLSARLRPDPRADAPQAHGPLAEVLEAGRSRVPGVPERASISSRPPELNFLKSEV